METFHAATMFALSIIIVLSALDVKADMPDGVVYTDGKKHIIQGEDAVLKCQFRGLPLAVYWKKGNDPRSAPNLITWYGDEPPTGSCVEGGSCEMDADFSLILKRANMADTGRYICNASYYGGISHHNFTDVKIIDLDPVGIYTEHYVTGWAGFSVSLPCIFRVEAKTVLWERVYWNAEDIVNEIMLRYTEGEYEVLGDVRYSWSKNTGLIIRDLNITDEGNCTCLVSTFDGTEIKNSTILAVKDPGQLSIDTEPYLTGWVGSSVSLPCNFTVQAKEVLWERVNWDGGSKVQIILSYTSDGSEGPGASRYSWSENYGLTIRDLHISDEGNFTCVVSTVDGIEIKNSTVLAINDNKFDAPVLTTKSTTVTIIVISVLIAVVIFIMVRVWQYRSVITSNTRTAFRCTHTITWDCFRWVFCGKKPDWINADTEQQWLMEQERKLDNLRKQLKEYPPGKATNIKNTKRFPRVINLGVFGVKDVGKSSLINSLSFALKGTFKNVVSRVSDGGEGKFAERIRLTKYITILDNRGMRDLSEGQIRDSLIPGIFGERGVDSDNGVPVVTHCPIFVHDIRKPLYPMHIFLKQFTSAVHQHYGRHVMVVFTHTNTVKNPDLNISCTHNETGIPEEYIWSFENYTENKNDEDVEKSIGYLEFLQKCIEIGEKNIHT